MLSPAPGSRAGSRVAAAACGLGGLLLAIGAALLAFPGTAHACVGTSIKLDPNYVKPAKAISPDAFNKVGARCCVLAAVAAPG